MNVKFASLVIPLLLPLTVDAAEALNVKVGLWEVTTDTEMTGMPALPAMPPSVLEKLPPEQRAALQAILEAQASKGPIHTVSKECLTKEDLAEPFTADEVEGCQRTLVSSTRTSQEMRLVCTGRQKGSGVFKVNTPTPESMTGELDLKVGEGTQPVTIQSRMQGKWLGADCGKEAE